MEIESGPIKKKQRRNFPASLKTQSLKMIAHNTDRLSSLEGLPPEDIERIFEMVFLQPSNAAAAVPVRRRRYEYNDDADADIISKMRVFLSPGTLTTLNLSFMTKADLAPQSSHRPTSSSSPFLTLIQLLSQTHLKRLILPTFWNDEMINHLTSSVPCPSELDISGCTWIGEAAAQAISTRWSGLEVLEARQCFAPISSNNALCNTLAARCSSLRVLDLSGCGYPCVNDAFIAQLVKTASNLQDLKLRGCWRLTEVAMYTISASPAGCKTLRLLDIGDIDGLSAFALCSLKGCQAFEELSCCWLKGMRPQFIPSYDVVLPRLGEACQHLRRIDMRGREVREDVIKMMKEKYDVQVDVGLVANGDKEERGVDEDREKEEQCDKWKEGRK